MGTYFTVFVFLSFKGPSLVKVGGVPEIFSKFFLGLIRLFLKIHRGLSYVPLP